MDERLRCLCERFHGRWKVLERVEEDDGRPLAFQLRDRAGVDVGPEGLPLQAQRISADGVKRVEQDAGTAADVQDRSGWSTTVDAARQEAAGCAQNGVAGSRETPRRGAVPGVVACEITVGGPGHCRPGSARRAAQNRSSATWRRA